MNKLGIQLKLSNNEIVIYSPFNKIRMFETLNKFLGDELINFNKLFHSKIIIVKLIRNN